MEPFHLFRYLDEQQLGYNRRYMDDAERLCLVASQVAGKRVTTGN
jgi:hypothetical protein